MTKNQIDYAKLREEERHNRKGEELTERDVGAKELTASTGYESMKENARHNLATEAYSYANLDELRRHNVSLENINWYTAQSDRIYKEGQVEIGFRNAQTQQDAQLETVRHNKFNELEETRHNQVVEGYDSKLKYAQQVEAEYAAVKNEKQAELYERQAARELNATYIDSFKASAQSKYWENSIEEAYVSDALDFASNSLKAFSSAGLALGG